MNAFFSGTDDADDRGSCYFSGVVGTLSSNPSLVFRFNMGKVKIDKVPLEMMFEEHVETPEIPKEWLGQVKKEVFTSHYAGNSFRGEGGRFASNLYGYGSDAGSAYERTYGRGNYGGGRSQVGKSVAGSHPKGSSVDDLTDDDLLGRLGFPFVPDEEGQGRPFSSSRQPRNKNTRAGGVASKKQSTAKQKPVTRKKPK